MYTIFIINLSQSISGIFNMIFFFQILNFNISQFFTKVYYGQHQNCYDLPIHLQEGHKREMCLVLVSYFKKSSQEQNRTQCTILMLLVSVK